METCVNSFRLRERLEVELRARLKGMETEGWDWWMLSTLALSVIGLLILAWWDSHRPKWEQFLLFIVFIFLGNELIRLVF